MTCWPWFTPQYRALSNEAWTKAIIPSGCGGADSNGNIPCSPESMRAVSEAWLAQNAQQALKVMGGRLSLDVYTFARYMQSEVGTGTVETRVAVGEAGLHKAQRSSKGLSALLLAPSGYYGPIHDASGGHPYGRWAATSQNPTIMTLLLASLVVSGASGNFSNSADDQDGPQVFVIRDHKTQTDLDNYVRGLASNRKFWVGPLPGVNPWETFLQFTPNFAERALHKAEWTQRGIAALQLPMRAPDWSGLTSVCSQSASSYITSAINNSVPKTAQSFLLASLGLAVGAGLASFAAKRYLRTP